MLPRLETIKEERKKLNLTQKKLAIMTGVSTSMINQIESGRSKPSYDTAKKIFESLAKLEGQASTHNAGDICSEKIVKLTLDSTIRDAGRKMHEKASLDLSTHSPVTSNIETAVVATETLMAAYQSIVEERTVALPLPSGENPLIAAHR